MGCCPSTTLKVKEEHDLQERTARNGYQPSVAPPPPPPVIVQDDNSVVALYTYQKRSDSDISFEKDDILIILDKSNKDWWKARNTRTRQEGYIPSNYVAPVDSLESKAWYFGAIKRSDSEAFLRAAEPGSFLVRESETRPGTLSLSVRGELNEIGQPIIKHFCIRTKSSTGEVFISNKIEFGNVSDLIEYYCQNKGLSIRLSGVCPRVQAAPETDGLAHDVWEVPRHTIKLHDKLGHGCFGEVWAATFNNTKKVAVKSMKEGTMDADKFLEEANVMKRLRHPHILQLQAICSREEPIWIITELMVNGSLQDYLHKKGTTLVKENGSQTILINMAAQCADGMAYLEAQSFIHRDLAARNVLVGEANLCKIADFGLSREDIYQADVKTKFPIKWTAPEAAFYQQYSIKSDVWSFGILMYEIITLGKVPYPGMRGQEVLEQLEKGYRMPQPPEAPDGYYSIMRDCWKNEKTERPSFETLKWQLDDFTVAMEGQYDET